MYRGKNKNLVISIGTATLVLCYSFSILLDPAQEILRKFSPAKKKPYIVIIDLNGEIIYESEEDHSNSDQLVQKLIRAQFKESA